MKGWFVGFSVALFLFLFIPLHISGGNILMFWDLLGVNDLKTSWLILSALSGVVIFICSFALGSGFIRGGVIGTLSLVFLVLYTILIKGDSGTGVLEGQVGAGQIFATLGQISLALLYTGALLVNSNNPATAPRVITGIAGGFTSLLFAISILLVGIATGSVWSSIIGNVVLSVLTLIAVVAGITGIVCASSASVADKLVKGIKKLALIYLISFAVWSLLQPLAYGLAMSRGADYILSTMLHSAVLCASLVIYLVFLISGSGEFFRSLISGIQK